MEALPSRLSSRLNSSHLQSTVGQRIWNFLKGTALGIVAILGGIVAINALYPDLLPNIAHTLSTTHARAASLVGA